MEATTKCNLFFVQHAFNDNTQSNDDDDNNGQITHKKNGQQLEQHSAIASFVNFVLAQIRIDFCSCVFVCALNVAC